MQALLTHLERPYDYADHEDYLDNDDDELGDHLGDEQLCHVDPCHPGTVKETFIALNQKNDGSQTNRYAKSDTERQNKPILI